MPAEVEITDIKLDSAAIAALLKGPEVEALVQRAAFKVRRHLQADGAAHVYVNTFTTDRQAAQVVGTGHQFVAHNLRSGALKRAAIAAGLEIADGGQA